MKIYTTHNIFSTAGNCIFKMNLFLFINVKNQGSKLVQTISWVKAYAIYIYFNYILFSQSFSLIFLLISYKKICVFFYLFVKVVCFRLKFFFFVSNRLAALIAMPVQVILEARWLQLRSAVLWFRLFQSHSAANTFPMQSTVSTKVKP